MDKGKGELTKEDYAETDIPPEVLAAFEDKLGELRKKQESWWEFEIVPGAFKQSEEDTDESKFNYLNEHFGVEDGWASVVQRLVDLNNSRKENEVYKLISLARHGQGHHNVAHIKYGQDAWEEKWSKLEGDGELVWGPDPLLSPLGIDQARSNGELWQREIKEHGAPVPTRLFVSPLSRSIDTLIYTWENIVDTKKVHPYVMEDLRETTGIHTCDKRSSKSVIESKYKDKGFVIEPGFEEEDVYFKYDYRESFDEHAIRIYRAFNDIFDKTPEDPVINITSHSGTIRAQLKVLNHRPFVLCTGGVIPVLVKGTKHHH